MYWFKMMLWFQQQTVRLASALSPGPRSARYSVSGFTPYWASKAERFTCQWDTFIWTLPKALPQYFHPTSEDLVFLHPRAGVAVTVWAQSCFCAPPHHFGCIERSWENVRLANLWSVTRVFMDYWYLFSDGAVEAQNQKHAHRGISTFVIHVVCFWITVFFPKRCF